MERLQLLFADWSGARDCQIAPLTASGSHRRYFRITGGDRSAIGVIGTDIQENRAFTTIASHFRAKGINVPQIYGISEDGMTYLQEDLGDISLFSALRECRETGVYDQPGTEFLLSTIRALPAMQFEGAEGLDWDICYPDREFNARMVDFDLNYFKYCYLKTCGIEFNEISLQDDFDRMKQDLLACCTDTFMYRDFQARNVMVRDGKPWFIDFQGGRKGPVWYDLASFLWQARAHYPAGIKQLLTDAYLESAAKYRSFSREDFGEKMRLFVLFRTLQVLGAYGYRGKWERKEHFIASIPGALDNLRELLETPFVRYPYLDSLLRRLCTCGECCRYSATLTVDILSFSYRKGIPEDVSGNGGGYVFDCRGMHNPGRYEQFRHSTGMDADVISFLEERGEVFSFMSNVYALADPHIERYIARDFGHLQFSFGCTGGQHRSVYCAEALARHISSKFNISIRLTHREQGVTKTFGAKTGAGPCSKAIIFAAGLGTRLKPLTDTRPKALAEVGGTPVIDLAISRIKECGISDITVNTHHFADMMKAHLSSFEGISISEEKELLDTGGGILHARPTLEGGGRFLVHNVDILSNADLQGLMAHKHPGAIAEMLVSPRKSSRYLLFNQDMRLVGWTNVSTGEIRTPFKELDVSGCRRYAYAGIQIISDKIFQIMEDYGMSGKFSIIDFYLEICASHCICGVLSEDLKLLDVGKVETLAMAPEFIAATSSLCTFSE